MIIEPKIKGFVCITSHPVGCRNNVIRQIKYVQQRQLFIKKPLNVLIIGASTGYGLASRIVAAFGAKASTIGVFYERESDGKRTASAGWYNSVAFEKEAHNAGLYAKSINGDAFSSEIKQQVIELIQKDWHGQVDLIIYSLAAPRRKDNKTNEIYQSVLKPIGNVYRDKTVNFISGEVYNIELEPASENEIWQTERVMGGDDWELWIDALLQANVIATGATTIAYSYVGPQMTYPIYRHGTIGKAKEHLEATAQNLNAKLSKHCEGKAFVSVNKGLVTQASSAIPVVPLYISLLYKVMKDRNLHEDCIAQMWRLFAEKLYINTAAVPVDKESRIRLDEYELQSDVQNEVEKLWQKVNSDNLQQISDINGYREEFYQLFGFNVPGVDYNKEIDIQIALPSF